MNAITRNILRLNPNYINNLKEGQVTEKDISFALKNGYTITEETPQFIIDIASFIDDIQTKPLSEKILTNIVKVNPKFINKLKENQVTYEMLNIALYKGYEFDKETPDFLYKYYSNKEYDLGQKELNVEQFRYYLMGIDYKYNSNFNCPFSLDGLGDEDYKKAIDIIKQNISKFNFYDSLLNNKELTYYYIEKLGFHNFSYSDYKKIYEYTDDYERLFNIIQNSNSNFDFSEINTELLRVWVKHDPKILLEDKLRWHIDSIDQIVGDVINLGILSYEDFKDKNITHNNAVVDILLQHDFSLIKHVKCTDTNFLLNTKRYSK